MKIIAAKLEDISAIVAMLADDKLGEKREDFQDPLPQTYVDAFLKIDIDQNQHLVVLVNESEQVIGTMQLSFITYLTYQGGTRAQIEAVRIHKDYRGQQLGKQLFNWAIQKTKDKGAHVLQLTTDKQRPDALRFYVDLGFKASHEGMKMHFEY